ncbi:LacI family DNA-binding transcriptional regulator [Desertimonas flava]|uniref:LacI family DNA-binding transcriptional regulator n=1 Tax=Desertimonas flava TaxID=2064846 RepID=UPI000E35374E|nr:LacI family DNA-binding transcriptional regulator [Desertimonas flava]
MSGPGDGAHLTLEQIGQRAGVSRSTVSRVLNGQRDVRPEVRARVEAVIAETGYHPNPAARALVSRRSGLIGLVMLTEVDELFGDPYYSALVNGIQQGCSEHDLISAIFPAAPGPGSQSEALTPQIGQRFVDGVIITAVPQSGPMIEALIARGKRMVVIGHPADDARVTRIDVENRPGSAQAVEHLAGHGKRRIAYVGPPAEYPFGVDRHAGYLDALTATGLSDDGLVQFDDPSVEGGYRAAASLLDHEPEAIFAATDTMAEGAYRAIAERGLRIPDDIAVVGFDGLPRGAVLDPVLTTVVQPVVEVGRRAVGLLASDQPDSLVLPVTLRLGGSCGPH